MNAFRVKICLVVISLISFERASAKEDWHLNVFAASLTAEEIASVIAQPSDYDFANNLIAITLARRVGSYKGYLDFELEGQFAQHFGDQEYGEFNGLFVVRWLVFPWNQYFKTSFAVGEGLSLTTETPELEKRNHDHASQFLNYLLFEFAFSLSTQPSWAVITRLHHRSGVFGLFDNVTGASNGIGIGLKYKF